MIHTLSFQNFRNLTENITLQPGVNLLIARNGAGKSNFVDGIYHISRGKSFRSFIDGNNISWTARVPFARIDARLQDGTALAMIMSQQNGMNRKRYEVNGAGKRRDSFVSHLKSILFAPHDLDIVSGSPEVRRSELDEFLSIVNPAYEQTLREYKQVLVNRNKLLQAIVERKSSERELSFWDEKLTSAGSSLMFERQFVLEQFLPQVDDYARRLFGGEVKDMQLQYLSRFSGEEEDILKSFRDKLEQSRFKELAAGRTLYGPHRDDIEILFGGRPIRMFGSRGQQRLAALIVKFAMLNFIDSQNNGRPVLLLDDVMSELDPDHRANLEGFVKSLGLQTVVTGTDEAHFTGKFLQESAPLLLKQHIA